MIRRIVPILLIGVALTAAACSSSTNSSTTTTNRKASTTASMATTTTSSGPAQCTTKTLAITPGQSSGAAGHIMTPIIFTNSGSIPCVIGGFPGVAGTNASGAQIAQAGRTGASKGTISLAPGAAASTTVTGVDVPSGNQTTCPTFAGILVTPPNDVNSVQLSVQIPGCAGFSVSAVVPGSAGI